VGNEEQMRPIVGRRRLGARERAAGDEGGKKQCEGEQRAFARGVDPWAFPDAATSE
jgi:hypothetical protein